MNGITDSVLVLLVLSCFLLLGAGRVAASIRILAIQGFMVGMLPLVLHDGAPGFRLVLIGGAIAVLKGIVLPRWLARTLRDTGICHETPPLIGNATSILLGVAALVAIFWLEQRLNLPVSASTALAVSTGFMLMATGLFLIIARSMALHQVIGYLALENGMYMFGLAVVRDIPLLVELGVLVDLIVAVFVMGIAINRIARKFAHADSDQLSMLKG